MLRCPLATASSSRGTSANPSNETKPTTSDGVTNLASSRACCLAGIREQVSVRNHTFSQCASSRAIAHPTAKMSDGLLSSSSSFDHSCTAMATQHEQTEQHSEPAMVRYWVPRLLSPSALTVRIESRICDAANNEQVSTLRKLTAVRIPAQCDVLRCTRVSTQNEQPKRTS